MNRISPLLLISACLCGVPCRYDGASRAVEFFVRLAASGMALPVCPEVMGGLGIPRPPCELYQGQVLTREGADRTEAFTRGAARTLLLAKSYGIGTAVLKEKSPSCGSSLVYDGRFSGICIPGQGVTAALLIKNGVRVFNEKNVPRELWQPERIS